MPKGGKLGTHEHFGKHIIPTEEELYAMGMKKYPAPPVTVKVCRPQHYGARACMWVTEWVDERTFEWYTTKYPTMQIIERKGKRK